MKEILYLLLGVVFGSTLVQLLAPCKDKILRTQTQDTSAADWVVLLGEVHTGIKEIYTCLDQVQVELQRTKPNRNAGAYPRRIA